jgi:hypothetical protein
MPHLYDKFASFLKLRFTEFFSFSEVHGNISCIPEHQQRVEMSHGYHPLLVRCFPSMGLSEHAVNRLQGNRSETGWHSDQLYSCSHSECCFPEKRDGAGGEGRFEW